MTEWGDEFHARQYPARKDHHSQAADYGCAGVGWCIRNSTQWFGWPGLLTVLSSPESTKALPPATWDAKTVCYDRPLSLRRRQRA